MFAIGDKEWAGLSKLVEECGEVQQVLGKLIGSRGDVNHYDGSNLRDRLEEELADLLAAIMFFTMANGLGASGNIGERAKQKYELFVQWCLEGK